MLALVRSTFSILMHVIVGVDSEGTKGLELYICEEIEISTVSCERRRAPS